MPVYVYECLAGHTTEERYLVEDRPTSVSCAARRASGHRCGRRADLVIQPCAIHTVATFSRSIDDADVRASIACDGSYLDPTLSFHPETNEVVAPITSEKQRQRLMKERGLFEKPPSDKARDVQRLKRTRPVHVLT